MTRLEEMAKAAWEKVVPFEPWAEATSTTKRRSGLYMRAAVERLADIAQTEFNNAPSTRDVGPMAAVVDYLNSILSEHDNLTAPAAPAQPRPPA